jgi:hypothetical protein
MKNVTVTLDEKVLAWARREAARRGISVSRLISETLTASMRELRVYNEAMRRYLSNKPVKLKSEGERYPTRAELYDRSRLR